MDSTPYIENSKGSYVVFPQYGDKDDGVHRFRWHCHFPLQHPFPAKECVSRTIVCSGRSYSMGVHNHLDRITYCDAESPVLPKTTLIEKKVQHPPGSRRQALRCVATFEENCDFPTVDLAFKNSQLKLSECLHSVRAFLAECQRCAPFACAWLLTTYAL